MKHQSHPNKIMTLIYVYILGNGQNDRSAVLVLRGPTHQKWSNFAIFGFIVQFDPWVGAHIWKKN